MNTGQINEVARRLSNSLHEMQADFALILIATAFTLVGLAVVQVFPEASLLAAFFLVGLLLLNIAFAFA